MMTCFHNTFLAQQTIDIIKKDAAKLYEDEEFTEAYKYYAQLVANFPKDPEYNYRLGVCMIFSEEDKKKCLPYLKQATTAGSESPKEVYFYLGKAYHINYLFDDAIKNYNEFKKTASPSLQKKLQVDREISACMNGKRLLSNLTDLEIKSKKELNEADYFRTYDLKTIGGKLLVKPEEFRTSIDKKKKEKSIVYLPKASVSSKVFFSSYGNSSETGKDIYFVTKTPNGFGPPQKVQGINSEFDEDYPFLHPNGKTLYFSSKGFNSMGGYDIFKSTYDGGSNTWSAPENLQFPINSPDDDYLYVTDSLEQSATFSTGRQSPPGKIDVLKINTERIPIDVLAIKGIVKKETPSQGIASFITIKNIETDATLGVIAASDLGEYKMELPNGGKILYSVETPGVKTQTAEVILPLAQQSKPFKQEITYEKGRLNIINYFDETASDSTYMQYLEVIEKKAKLDVTTPIKKTVKKPEIVSVVEDTLKKVAQVKKPVIVEEETNAPPTNTTTTQKAVDSNTNLAATEKNESKPTEEQTKVATETNKPIEAPLKTEAEQTIVQTETNPATEAPIKTEESNKETTENKTEANANTTQKLPNNKAESKQMADASLKEAERKIQEAKQFERDAKSVLETGNALLADANKNIEAANQEILAATAANDNEKRAEAIEKRAGAQKDSIAAQKIVVYGTGLQDEALAKRQEGEKNQKYAQELLNNGNAIDNNSPATANAEGKKPKNTPKTTKVKKEVKPKEEIASNQNNSVTENENAVETNVVSSADLTNKYRNKIITEGEPNKNQIKQNNILLSHYNFEIDAAIKGNQALLKKTKDVGQKQNIKDEIAALQKIKSQNTELITANREQLATNGNSENSENKSVSKIEANTASEAIQKIEDLKNSLVINDNENFDFNSYQNAGAQSLKVEADARINDAIAKQKQLKNELDKTIEAFLKSENGSSVSKSDAELTSEADGYHEKSLKLEADAKKKQGAEKTKLLAESKKLEEKANNTYLAAASQSQNKNQTNIETNQENLSNLIKENKSSEAELAEAQKLETEANTAIKQAQTIRQEADAITNKTIKVANYFNAEEKENEAIQKQQQAIDILKKSNPEFVLKSNSTNASGEAGITEGSVQQKLEALNNSINELADIKIDSYQKLSMANTTEVDSLSEKVGENIEILDRNPKLKSDIVAANNKLNASKKLKAQADTTQNKAKKVNLLIAAVKKQNEALKQLNGVTNSMNPNYVPPVAQNTTAVNEETQTIANEQKNTNAAVTENNSTAKETEKETQNIANNTTTEDNRENKVVEPVSENNNSEQTNTKTNESISENNNPVKENNTNNKANTAVENETTVAENSEPPISNEKIEELVNAPALKVDTNTAQIITFFDSKSTELNNPAANKMFTGSLAQLKKYDAELAALENAPTNNAAPIIVNLEQAAELRNKSEMIIRESDNLNIQSIETKKEAKTKEGAEKETLLAKATELENEALDKNIEATELLLQSNEMEVQNNSNMIGAYFTKLKKENPTLYSELDAKNLELVNIRNQIKQIRDEAKSMTSKGAMFGSLSNAQERETELMQKQTDLVSELKKQYPDFVYNPSDVPAPNTSNEPSVETKLKKKQIISKQQDELTKLSNALRLEFETKKYSIPNKLSPQDEQSRTLVMRLNAESKRLLVQSAQQKDENTKTKFLSLAAKYAAESLAELNKIASKQPIANNATNKPKNNFEQAVEDLNAQEERINEAKNTKVKEKPVKKVVAKKPEVENTEIFNSVINNEPETTVETNKPANIVRIEGLEVKTVNAYNENRPIPLDAKIEDGLVFRVQIGAFKNKLPNNTFKGLSPLNAESTNNGYFRYTAGNFNKFELANAVKNDLRSLGYSDAFVVGFNNGKRIPLSEALDILTKEGKMIDRNAMQTAGITLNANVPRAAVNPVIAANLVVSKQLEKVNGLLYTIQIGVYNKQVTKQQLFNLRPIFSEELPTGLFRYAAGIYNNVDRLLNDKRKVSEMGLRDAFVTAYLNGKRIGFGEAKDKQVNDSTVKMETEEPIIFPAPEEITNEPVAPTIAQNIVPAFTNGVKEYPAATPENGIKKSDKGVCFKVQIGAYSKQVPNDVAAKFKTIKNWPIESKLITALYIYSIGNFSSANFAKTLKNEAINLGIEDAFIVVYKDGNKLYGEEARKYMSQ